MMNLGENIYRLRTEKNMSQEELAGALEVSRQSVSKWENNSATPELEKLVKMSELFGVTLDELVGKEKPNTPTENETPLVQHIVIESRPNLPVKKVIGTILLCIGFLFIPISLSAISQSVFLGCLLLALLFLSCGIFCLVFPYPYVFCGWSAWVAFCVDTFMLTPRWEEAYLQLVLVSMTLIAMIIWTVLAHRKKRIHIPTFLWWLGGILLAALMVLFIINFVPPIGITSSADTVMPGK